MIDLNLNVEPEMPETPQDQRAREAYEKWAQAQEKRVALGDLLGIVRRFVLVRV